MYITVYVSGMEMSPRIRFWYQSLPKILAKKSLFGKKKFDQEVLKKQKKKTKKSVFWQKITCFWQNFPKYSLIQKLKKKKKKKTFLELCRNMILACHKNFWPK